ncbi:MAG: T9SS type A sorting domain-containing protein, partial [Flavobacteriaceae bacterium]|nr:T9SS type A sorting domain-containing protein [Flavobacteriaceae bacterium]NNK28800.1 T9SS type A sorting domain-containing protein [Flavobacteriaceae bacterium]
MISFGQSECPTTIKTSGQSSPDNPIFTVPNGNNGCSAGWPATITVDGSLTYSYVGCTGGNLEYILDPISQTPPDTFEMTIDFGNGLVCSYDASGSPVVLSNLEFQENLNKLSIYPNPIYSSEILNFEFSRDMSFKIRLFDLVGKVVFRKSYFEVQKASNRFSELDSGMYIARIETEELIIIRKIIIKK